MPTTITPVIPGIKSTTPLYLIGTGIRKKNLYLVELDIYRIGVVVPISSMGKVDAWAKNKTTANQPLSNFLLTKHSVPIKSNDPNPIRLGLLLKFCRGVGKDLFVDAFRTAFKGIDNESFELFRIALENTMGSNGMQANEEMQFYFFENGDIILTKNGIIGGKINNHIVSQRLLDVYIDPSRSVSKELVDSLDQYALSVVEMTN